MSHRCGHSAETKDAKIGPAAGTIVVPVGVNSVSFAGHQKKSSMLWESPWATGGCSLALLRNTWLLSFVLTTPGMVFGIAYGTTNLSIHHYGGGLRPPPQEWVASAAPIAVALVVLVAAVLGTPCGTMYPLCCASVR